MCIESIKKYIENARRMNDRLTNRVIYEELWMLPQIGFNFFTWQSNAALYIAIYAVYFVIMLSMFVIYATSSIVGYSDLTLLSQNVHLCIVHLVSLAAVYSTMVQRDFIFLTYNAIAQGFFTYKVPVDSKDFLKIKQLEKQVLVIFWPLYYGMCAMIAAIIGPTLDFRMGYVAEERHSIAGNLPIPIWFPLDTKYTPYYLLGVGLEVAGALFASLSVASGVLLLVVGSQHIILQYNILLRSLEMIEQRAEEQYEKELNRALDKCNRFKDLEYVNIYVQCLQENMAHHALIRSLFSRYAKVVSIPIFVPFVGGAILIAMAVVHILSESSSPGAKLLSFSLCIGETLNILMICIYGERLADLERDVRFKVYSLKWYKVPLKCKGAISILQEVSYAPLIILAGGLLPVSMETFASIMNSAYSFTNLVLAFKE